MRPGDGRPAPRLGDRRKSQEIEIKDLGEKEGQKKVALTSAPETADIRRSKEKRG